MKLTTILSNYKEFRESYKKIGYSQPTINLNDKRQIELLLTKVINDIILFNDILNIYDYTEKEKEKIKNFLNKLNLKQKTFLHILTQKNIDNYYEDASILEDDYNDTQLFENFKNFNLNKQGKFEVIFSDGIVQLKKFNNLKLAYNFSIEKIKNNNIKELAIYQNKPGFHSTTQKEYLELWYGKNSYWGNMSIKDKSLLLLEIIPNIDTQLFENIKNLNESFDIKKIKLKYTPIDKKAYETQKSSIEFIFSINGIEAVGFWNPYFEYVSSGVDINELRPINKRNYSGFNIFDGGGGYRMFEIHSKLDLLEKQPKDLRFTGRYYSTLGLKNVFLEKIKNALENPEKEPKLSQEFLKYFKLIETPDSKHLYESIIEDKINNMSFITESQNFEQEDMELFEFLDKHNFTSDEVVDNEYISEKIYNYLENKDLLDIYEKEDINLLARKYLDYWETEKIS